MRNITLIMLGLLSFLLAQSFASTMMENYDLTHEKNGQIKNSSPTKYTKVMKDINSFKFELKDYEKADPYILAEKGEEAFNTKDFLTAAKNFLAAALLGDKQTQIYFQEEFDESLTTLKKHADNPQEVINFIKFLTEELAQEFQESETFIDDEPNLPSGKGKIAIGFLEDYGNNEEIEEMK